MQGAGWLTLEDLRWDTGDGPGRGRLTTQAASTYKLPSFSEMPRTSTSRCSSDAHEDGAVYGSKAVGEPPLMLAFSVREALRQACAAFGPARDERRAGLAGHARGGLLGGRAGPLPTTRPCRRGSPGAVAAARRARRRPESERVHDASAMLTDTGSRRCAACARRASPACWSR